MLLMRPSPDDEQGSGSPVPDTFGTRQRGPSVSRADIIFRINQVLTYCPTASSRARTDQGLVASGSIHAFKQPQKSVCCVSVQGPSGESRLNMLVAIEDTYGPTGPTKSMFVSGARRTHVAVVFSESEADEVRTQLRECLDLIREYLPSRPKEFHFVDIYNGSGRWKHLKDDRRNIALIEAFCKIYSQYRWPVYVQTLDDRTLRDHGIAAFKGKIDGLDLSDRHDLSLFFLCIKLKRELLKIDEGLTLIVDEGKYKAGRSFGEAIFRAWPRKYNGYYSSSALEPLLQIADLLAFCINRSTHLAMKDNRTETDLGFLDMVWKMKIRSKDLAPIVLPRDFSVRNFDRFHYLESVRKHQ
jgi:hypothetical protein